MPRLTAMRINIDRALELWEQSHNWHSVAALMRRPDGRPFTSISVYHAVHRAGRMPFDGRRGRPSDAHRDGSDSNLGHIWRPGKERWLPTRPDYKTGRVVPNEVREEAKVD